MATENAPGCVGERGVQVRAVARNRSRERDDLEVTVVNFRLCRAGKADGRARQAADAANDERRANALLANDGFDACAQIVAGLQAQWERRSLRVHLRAATWVPDEIRRRDMVMHRL